MGSLVLWCRLCGKASTLQAQAEDPKMIFQKDLLNAIIPSF